MTKEKPLSEKEYLRRRKAEIKYVKLIQEFTDYKIKLKEAVEGFEEDIIGFPKSRQILIKLKKRFGEFK